MCVYSVIQSDRNSSKTNTFHRPTTYEPHVKTFSKGKITYARHEYGRVGLFKIKMSLEVIASRKGSIFKMFLSDCCALLYV